MKVEGRHLAADHSDWNEDVILLPLKYFHYFMLIFLYFASSSRAILIPTRCQRIIPCIACTSITFIPANASTSCIGMGIGTNPMLWLESISICATIGPVTFENTIRTSSTCCATYWLL